MTWIKFVLFLSGMYAAYYSFIISWDSLQRRAGSKPEGSPELTFAEYLEPQKPGPEYAAAHLPSAMVASGGVRLKKLFSLSLEDTLEYTRAVSF